MSAPIIYHMSMDLDSSHSQMAAAWVHRFAEFVALPPCEVACEFRAVESTLRQKLRDFLGKADMVSVSRDVLWTMSTLKLPDVPKLVVFCSAASDLAKKAKAAHPYALLGIPNGCLSVIYQHEPSVAWHELFHLLGAEDCYRRNSPHSQTEPTCGHKNCVMQYAPSLGLVGDPPFICEANVNHIRGLWGVAGGQRSED